MARDKGATAEFLGRHGIPTPKTASVEQVLTQPEAYRWPMILKPRGGSSSVGIQTANDLAEFKMAVSSSGRLSGPGTLARTGVHGEYFLRSTRRLAFCAVPHLRKNPGPGKSAKASFARHPVLMDLAERIRVALKGARGALQTILADDNSAAVFEINARFGGGYPHSSPRRRDFFRSGFWKKSSARHAPRTMIGRTAS